jgi:DNA polymerase III delta prime subunit
MIKAGLTDPSKPFGVFLFVGPTGTGKTEITKMLAEYLFSSPDRMIRLDMSEFQTADANLKIFGDYSSKNKSFSLVNEIRKIPSLLYCWMSLKKHIQEFGTYSCRYLMMEGYQIARALMSILDSRLSF